MGFLAAVVPPLLLALAADTAGRAWVPRKPPVEPPRTHELRSPERWPAEPETPGTIDAARFRQALSVICRRAPDAVPADEVLAASVETEVDAFMLAALVFERSRCDERRTTRGGYGLLGVQPGLYLHPGAPPPPLPRQAFSSRALLQARHNLDVGARLLRMWQDEHEDLDQRFGGAPHRGGVAHFFWGDRIRSAGSEDLVYTTRRRLLARYDDLADEKRTTTLGMQVVSPLEGTPRVATSGPGEDRDGGMRRHRGIDIVASEGEPVRTVADGSVIFAGVNLRGAPRRGPIPPEKIARYRHRRMGAGGIYLCIVHDSTGHEVVSCYMHLSTYVVAEKERVTAGQLIGYVGRTGVRVSPPHLHFELRVDDKAKNPLRYFGDLVIPPRATKTWKNVMAAKRARVRTTRAAPSGGT